MEKNRLSEHWSSLQNEHGFVLWDIRVRHSQQVNIVEHLGVSHDKAHLITEASTLLQPLGSCGS